LGEPEEIEMSRGHPERVNAVMGRIAELYPMRPT
jgi:hypothetical protein